MELFYHSLGEAVSRFQHKVVCGGLGVLEQSWDLRWVLQFKWEIVGGKRDFLWLYSWSSFGVLGGLDASCFWSFSLWLFPGRLSWMRVWSVVAWVVLSLPSSWSHLYSCSWCMPFGWVHICLFKHLSSSSLSWLHFFLWHCKCRPSTHPSPIVVKVLGFRNNHQEKELCRGTSTPHDWFRGFTMMFCIFCSLSPIPKKNLTASRVIL